MSLEVKIKLKHPGVKIPTYATDGSGCFDIFPDIEKDKQHFLLSPGSATTTIGTGLYFEIPKGKALMVYSRSGQGFNHNTRLANCVGVIDSDYRGELKVKLKMDGDGYLYIDPEKAIAQGMIIDASQVTFSVVEELSETERGTGGFGSTDRKG